MLAMETYELSRDEILELINRKCERLQMDARDLLSAYRRGERIDVGQVADVIGLAELLEDNDPVFAAPAR